jgi:hypothetical protein
VEITSSGLNSAGAGEGEQNRHRALPQNVRVDNFATLTSAAGAAHPWWAFHCAQRRMQP